METIYLTIKEGPVFIRSLGPEGINNMYELWDGIVGGENFPKTSGSAFYILKLNKKVETYGEVERAKKLLEDAAKSLVQVWQFASGSRMALERIEIYRTFNLNYEINADEVKKSLIFKEGIKPVTSIEL